jgi:sugar phosphate isomerase/epimerase
MPPTFGVSEFTTWPWSFERDVERYAAHGVDAIEVCEFKLNRSGYERQLAEVERAGLRVSSVQSRVHSLFPASLAPQPADLRQRLRHVEEAVDAIAPHVPPGTPFVVVTGAAPGGDVAAVYDAALTALAELARFAHDRGVRLAFEPLNPILFNTDTALWGLDRALELVRTVDHPALGLCVDTWNVFQTPDLPGVIGRCRDRIFLVQLGDWRTPRCAADRVSLGDGCIDNRGIVSAVREAGYRGPCVLELFSEESLPDSIWRSDLDAVLERNRAAFERICEGVP